ncbi:MAG: cytidylate kinase family protein, partial [Clostridia bacterium]|nr:cytidylate kinase family protein [Clostridia bacterium]
QLAEERGMSALEFNRMCENDRSADYMIDNKTTEVSRARRDDKILFDSRMAWHFAENSFKVYLYVPIEVSVKRIMGDSSRGNVEEYTDAADAEAKILARMQSESLRYREFYGVDNHDLNNYDLILCTSAISPEEAADTIWREYNTYLENPEGYPKPKKLYME